MPCTGRKAVVGSRRTSPWKTVTAVGRHKERVNGRAGVGLPVGGRAILDRYVLGAVHREDPWTEQSMNKQGRSGTECLPLACYERCMPRTGGILGSRRPKVDIPVARKGSRLFGASVSDLGRPLDDFTARAGGSMDCCQEMNFYHVDTSFRPRIRVSLPLIRAESDGGPRELNVEMGVRIEDPRKFLGSDLRRHVQILGSLDELKLAHWLQGRMPGLLDEVRSRPSQDLDQIPVEVWQRWIQDSVMDFGLGVSLAKSPVIIWNAGLQDGQTEADSLLSAIFHQAELQDHAVRVLEMVAEYEQKLEGITRERLARELENLRLKEEIAATRNRMELADEDFRNKRGRLKGKRSDLETPPEPTPPPEPRPPQGWFRPVVLLVCFALLLAIRQWGFGGGSMRGAETRSSRVPEFTNSLGLPFVRVPVGDGTQGI